MKQWIGIIILVVLFLMYGYSILINKTKDSKISFREIIFDFKYLKNSVNKKNIKDIFLFLIAPLLIGISLIYFLEVDIEINDTVMTVLGIISAILLNFWTILVTISSEKLEKFIKELSSNIVVNILGTFLMMVIYLFKEILKISINNEFQKEIIKIGKVIYIFLLIFLIINFLMILQRIFLIVKNKDK